MSELPLSMSPAQAPDAAPIAPAAAAPPAAAETHESRTLLRAAARRHEDLARLLARPAEALKDSEFVHDVRVAARRLEEVARLLAGARRRRHEAPAGAPAEAPSRLYLDKPAARAVRASLRALRKSMGDLRDADVTCEHLLKWRIPGPVKRVAREIAAALETTRPDLAMRAAAQMGSASVAGAMVILARVLEEMDRPESAAESEADLRAIGEKLQRKRLRQLRQEFGRAAKKQTPDALHAARIAAKKLRYVLELLEEVHRGAKKKVREVKRLQQLLGDHHDAHVILEQVAAHLKDRREKPIRRLAPAWRSWHRAMNRIQARRAAEFFTRAYPWMNG